VEVLVTEDAPSPRNPLGVKGAGEGGTTAMGAAIAAAIDAALGVPLGVIELPVRPEAALRLAKAARPGSTSEPGGA
jgi:CO/xanthine dehydrogenase Mo-binding subunit